MQLACCLGGLSTSYTHGGTSKRTFQEGVGDLVRSPLPDPSNRWCRTESGFTHHYSVCRRPYSRSQSGRSLPPVPAVTLFVPTLPPSLTHKTLYTWLDFPRLSTHNTSLQQYSPPSLIQTPRPVQLPPSAAGLTPSFHSAHPLLSSSVSGDGESMLSTSGYQDKASSSTPPLMSALRSSSVTCPDISQNSLRPIPSCPPRTSGFSRSSGSGEFRLR